MNIYIWYYCINIIFSRIFKYIKLFNSPLNLIKLFSNQNIWIPWPDSYIIISELKKTFTDDIIYGLDPIIIGLGVFGIFLLPVYFIRKNMKGILKIDSFLFIIFSIWIVNRIFSTNKRN